MPVALAVVALVVALLAVNEFRPVTVVAATQSLPASTTAKGNAADLPWPSGAQGAIGVEGAGVIASSAAAKALPIASVAKVMTALVILDAKPLQPGQQGPTINVTADDANTYQQDFNSGQSVVAVEAGEQLSEYQALEGMLIPSGNNFATLTANWAFGSVRAAVDRMNEKATELGMARTHFTDPSGLQPQTVSTPSDLVRLGEAAMEKQVIAQIVGMGQADLPVAGTVYNVNYHLGTNFVVGIKTGSAPQAGAVYLFAATHQMPDGKVALIFGAVQNLHTLDLAFAAADNLLGAVRQRLQVQHVVSRNQTVGRIDAPWGSSSDLVAGKDLDVATLSGTVVRSRLQAEVTGAVAAGDQVGSLHVTAGDSSYDIPINAADGITAPGRLWRLTRTG